MKTLKSVLDKFNNKDAIPTYMDKWLYSCYQSYQKRKVTSTGNSRIELDKWWKGCLNYYKTN